MKMLRRRKKKIFEFEGPYADGNLDERAELMQMFANINRNTNNLPKTIRTTIGGPNARYYKANNSDLPKLLQMK
jgi:hypothetical protein